MLLSKNPRFISEYNEFKTKISAIEDPQGKDQLTKLLQDLMFEVKALDQKHQELTSQAKMPAGLDDTRSRLTEIRKKIISTLKVYESKN
jgi:hypothetical protein